MNPNSYTPNCFPYKLPLVEKELVRAQVVLVRARAVLVRAQVVAVQQQVAVADYSLPLRPQQQTHSKI